MNSNKRCILRECASLHPTFINDRHNDHNLLCLLKRCQDVECGVFETCKIAKRLSITVEEVQYIETELLRKLRERFDVQD